MIYLIIIDVMILYSDAFEILKIIKENDITSMIIILISNCDKFIELDIEVYYCIIKLFQIKI